MNPPLPFMNSRFRFNYRWFQTLRVYLIKSARSLITLLVIWSIVCQAAVPRVAPNVASPSRPPTAQHTRPSVILADPLADPRLSAFIRGKSSLDLIAATVTGAISADSNVVIFGPDG